jgi:poly-beta-1,6-N-acetyl-D-glucosamine synthase
MSMKVSNKKNSYVLITPAYNEVNYLERTIESICSQTVLPAAWVIVSDGSTDGTDEIIKKYASKYNFIKYKRMAEHDEKCFSCKVFAFNAGYKLVEEVQHHFIGNIDADISIENDYFEKLIVKFEEIPKLGVGGGIILELVNDEFIAQKISLNSVAGAVQLFRKECFIDIRGYIPLPFGGIDTAAEIKARAAGWFVQTFPELPVKHYRRVVTGNKSITMTRFKQGKSNYVLGYHPIFQIVIGLLKVSEKPYMLVSLYFIAGYFWAKITKMKKVLSNDVVKYLRQEQMKRLFQFGK